MKSHLLGKIVIATDNLLSVEGRLVAVNGTSSFIELEHSYGTFSEKSAMEIMNWFATFPGTIAFVPNFEVDPDKYYAEFKQTKTEEFIPEPKSGIYYVQIQHGMQDPWEDTPAKKMEFETREKATDFCHALSLFHDCAQVRLTDNEKLLGGTYITATRKIEEEA